MNDDYFGMEVNLGCVEDRSTVSFDTTFDIPTPEGGKSEVTAVTTVAVVRSGTRYELRAFIKGDVQAQCHRCLAPFHLPMEAAFDLVLNRGERAVPSPEGVEEEDFVAIPATGKGLYDIFPRVRETVILEIPIKLLCRDECKGVCRKCGADLNSGDCGCGGRGNDPRWGTLRKFLNGESKT
jgi:uncharacterized protein